MNPKSRLWRRSHFCSVATLVVLGCFANDVVSQETAAAIPKIDFAAAAAEYDVLSGSDRRECEPFQAELLRWTNPIRSTLSGTVFLWHKDGVPQAACSMYSYQDPGEAGKYRVNHEFVSLSTDVIEAKLGGESAWQTKLPGIAWQVVSESPPVPKSRPARLAQMRNVASEFSGAVGKKRVELRMLRQPIYRYPETMDRDGAIFAFVQATDPEMLLLLESAATSPEPTWRFAVARMTAIACSLSRRNEEVYSAAWCNPAADESHIYRTLHDVPWKTVEEK